MLLRALVIVPLLLLGSVLLSVGMCWLFGIARRYEEGLGDADPQLPGVEVTPRETAPRPHHPPVQRARRRATTLHVVRGGQGLRH